MDLNLLLGIMRALSSDRHQGPTLLEICLVVLWGDGSDRTLLLMKGESTFLAPCHLFPRLPLHQLWNSLSDSRSWFLSLKLWGKKNLVFGRRGVWRSEGSRGALRWRMRQTRGVSPSWQL